MRSGADGSVFVYSVRGQVEDGADFAGDDLCVTYCYTHGQDWEMIAGLHEGVSQITRQSEGANRKFVWNFPLQATFTSTNPHGWPQLVLNVYGKDFFGTDIVRGYAAIHLPLTPGTSTRRLRCFVPASASLLQRMVSWVTGNIPEFVDPKMVAQGRGREVTRVESQGYINLSFTVTMKDFAKLGYDCGASVLGSLSSRALLSAMERSADSQAFGEDVKSGARLSSNSREYYKNGAADGNRRSDVEGKKVTRKNVNGNETATRFEVGESSRGIVNGSTSNKNESDRGLFKSYQSGADAHGKNKYNNTGSVVMVGGEYVDGSYNKPGTSADGHLPDSFGQKPRISIGEAKEVGISNSFDDDDDDDDTDFDSDDSDKVGKVPTKVESSVNRHTSDDKTNRRQHERRSSDVSEKVDQSPRSTGEGGANRTSETGVAFSRESGITFVTDETSVKNKTRRGISPNFIVSPPGNSTKGASGDSGGSGVPVPARRKSSSIGIGVINEGSSPGGRKSSAVGIGVITEQSSRSKKRSDHSSPSSGIVSSGSSLGGKSASANLFSVGTLRESGGIKDVPPLPTRQAVLQPILARKPPLPGVHRE